MTQPKWKDATDAQRVEILFRTLTCLRACNARLSFAPAVDDPTDGIINEIDELVENMLDEVEGSGYQGIELPGDIGPDGEIEP